MTDDDTTTGRAPVPPDCMSLEEFAKTLEAERNAATWENLPDHGNRDGSAKLAAVTPEPPPPTDTLTTEQAFAAWRQLLAEGCAVEWPGDYSQSVCWIWSADGNKQRSGCDPDPLVAFTRAYRAFREGQGAE